MKIAYSDIGKLEFARARHFEFLVRFLFSSILPRPSLPGPSRFEIAGAAPPGAKEEGVVSMLVIDLELALKPARTGIGCRMGLSVASSNPGVVDAAAFTNRHEAPSPCLAAAKVFPRRLKGL